MNPEIRARFRVDRGRFALDVDLTLPGSGITALFGPSGSGKTTCLRAMAGLEPAADGRFAIGDTVWQDEARKLSIVPTHRRALGVVFQEPSLFPHLSVRGNMEFGQKRASTTTIGFSLPEITGLLGIAPPPRTHAGLALVYLGTQGAAPPRSILDEVESHTVPAVPLSDTAPVPQAPAPAQQ